MLQRHTPTISQILELGDAKLCNVKKMVPFCVCRLDLSSTKFMLLEWCTTPLFMMYSIPLPIFSFLLDPTQDNFWIYVV